uniref:Uncharacterized protein n=1 Tax=Timema monikensis TaxID=170555 RepID=A0A7R9E0J0_9NEOP|nr:unnamed protein product [Timema monikensis]
MVAVNTLAIEVKKLSDKSSLEMNNPRAPLLVLDYGQIYVSTLLSSGSAANIKATGDILQCREVGDYSKKVPFTRAVALVLQAATEYFDSAGDLLDPAMELARLCLHLILDEHEEIQEKLDLISSLQFLSDFGLTLLPLQVGVIVVVVVVIIIIIIIIIIINNNNNNCLQETVRLCDDRMRLIEACVRNKPKAYRQCVRLLKLAEKLRVAGADSRAREGQVLVLVAQTAFQTCHNIENYAV